MPPAPEAEPVPARLGGSKPGPSPTRGPFLFALRDSPAAALRSRRPPAKGGCRSAPPTPAPRPKGRAPEPCRPPPFRGGRAPASSRYRIYQPRSIPRPARLSQQRCPARGRGGPAPAFHSLYGGREGAPPATPPFPTTRGRRARACDISAGRGGGGVRWRGRQELARAPPPELAFLGPFYLRLRR